MPDLGDAFDDADPEDAWDASDHVPVLLDNVLVRLIDLFGVERHDRQARLARLFVHIGIIRQRVENGDL